MQNGRLRDNKVAGVSLLQIIEFSLKRAKLTEFHPKNKGRKFKWKRRKFRLGFLSVSTVKVQ